MKKSYVAGLWILLSVLAAQRANAQSYAVASPDQSVSVRIEATDRLQYSVTFAGQPVIAESSLGFAFNGEPDLQKDLSVVQAVSSSRHDVWTPVVKSKHATITDAYNELVLVTEEKAGLRRRMDIVFRAYDDGVAFRYRLYRSGHIGNRQLTGELTTFRIPGNPAAWVVEYATPYASSYEAEFKKKTLDDVTEKTIAGLPFLMKYSDSCWVAVTEAEIDNYPSFYIGTAGEKGHLTTKLSPLPGESEQGVKARFADDLQTPWRVIMIGATPGTLIESEIVQNLNPPCAIDDPSWIQPGKSAWDHWWSGDLKMEMPVIKEYIDLASEMGWPYMLVDWQWYGELFGKPGADICRADPQISMPEILSYAGSKNVRIWLWLNSADVNRNSAYKKAFPLYREWGIAGVKIDFMDRDDQEMVNWYHDMIRCAAENHLMVNFHGSYKPDGIIRTYPNAITREGLMGNEYYKIPGNRMSPEHNVKLAYTRMLAGPMDYTPGGFNNVTAESYKLQTPAVVANTRAAELAKFVVYESPYTVVCEHPRYLLGQPGADFLKTVPVVWDNIRFLGGTPDDYVAIAKQSGDQWFVGVLNNSREREIVLSTGFLPAGKYTVEIWEDAKDAGKNPKNIKKSTQTMESGKPLKVKMANAGGYVAHIKPL